MEISKHQPYPSTTKYLSLYHKIFFASSFDSLNCRPPTDVKDRASMLVIIFFYRYPTNIITTWPFVWPIHWISSYVQSTKWEILMSLNITVRFELKSTFSSKSESSDTCMHPMLRSINGVYWWKLLVCGIILASSNLSFKTCCT